MWNLLALTLPLTGNLSCAVRPLLEPELSFYRSFPPW